jgi:hypothetical protein
MIENYLEKNVSAINKWLAQEDPGKSVEIVIGSGRWQNIAAANVSVLYGEAWGCFFVDMIEEEYADGIVTANLDIRYTLLAQFEREVASEGDFCRDVVYRLYHEGRKHLNDKYRIVITNVRSVPFVNYTGDNFSGVRFRCTVRNIVPSYIECRI